LGSLKIGQSKEQLTQQLTQIKDSINRWAKAVRENEKGGDGDGEFRW